MESGHPRTAKTLLKIKMGGLNLLDIRINYKGVWLLRQVGSISVGIAK